MTEQELRKYIRREVLKEGPFSGAIGVVGQGTFLGTLLSSFDTAIETAQLVFKDILTSVHYLVRISFATDREQIEALKEKFKQKKEQIAQDYDQLWKSLDESMSTDFKALAYLMAPGPYIAAKLTMEGPGYGRSLKTYFNEAGFDIELPASKPPPGDPAARESHEWGRGIAKDLKTFKATQAAILAKLDARLGISATTESKEALPVIVEVSEDRISNDDKIPNVKADAERESKSFIDGIENVDDNKLVKPEVATQMLNAKKEEAKSYVDSLNRPGQLLAQLSKAKTLDETRKIVASLKQSPVKINAFSGDEEQKLVEAAKKMVAEAKQKKKQADLFKAAGLDAKQEQTDEKLLEAAIMVLTKEAIANFIRILSNPQKAGQEGKNLLDAFQVARKEFTDALMEGLDEKDFDLIKKTKHGAELVAILTKGKKDIASAGLTSPTQG